MLHLLLSFTDCFLHGSPLQKSHRLQDILLIAQYVTFSSETF